MAYDCSAAHAAHAFGVKLSSLAKLQGDPSSPTSRIVRLVFPRSTRL
jgi:hypothetical protein